MILFVAIYLFLSVLRGGKGFDSLLGIAPCSLMYWGFNIFIFIISILFFNKYSQEVEKNEELKKNYSFNFEKYG